MRERDNKYTMYSLKFDIRVIIGGKASRRCWSWTINIWTIIVETFHLCLCSIWYSPVKRRKRQIWEIREKSIWFYYWYHRKIFFTSRKPLGVVVLTSLRTGTDPVSWLPLVALLTLLFTSLVVLLFVLFEVDEVRFLGVVSMTIELIE